MDRFEWSNGELLDGEVISGQQDYVTLYDGDQKSSFEKGLLKLSNYRLLWKVPHQTSWLSLPLSLVVYTESESSGLSRSAKLVLHLSSPSSRAPGPVARSAASYTKLSFKEGGMVEFERKLNAEVTRCAWQQRSQSGHKAAPRKGPARAGIVGIERQIQEKTKMTDASISKAFQDLSKLMTKAKEMVDLSKSISQKLRDKQGTVSDDETVQLQSYLLSLGIADPVTRETHGSGSHYFAELAKQIATVMEAPLKECGGMMVLTDVYCRLNRARGMELLSPDDLVSGCQQLQRLRLPVRLRTFDSGVMVLHLAEESDEQLVQETGRLVQEHAPLSAENLSAAVGVSVLLAKQRLLLAESKARICRDETVEGVKFYPNLFITNT